jgi:uncharacterized OB-fold protein
MSRPPAEVFAEHCARGELAYQLDAEGRPLFPPTMRGVEWRVSAGRGAVYATTVVHRRGEDPYGVSLVDLDEGFRMMSRVDGEHAIGTRVRVRFEDEVPMFEVDA